MKNKLQILQQKLETELTGLSDEEILQKAKDNPEWRARISLLFAEYENAKYIQTLCDKLIESRKSAEKNIEQKCVYILKMNNGTVKIGCTNNFKKRMRAISTGSGLSVVNWCYSQDFDSDYAYFVERTCHEAFSSERIKGEFFNIAFDSAVVELAKYTDQFVIMSETIL